MSGITLQDIKVNQENELDKVSRDFMRSNSIESYADFHPLTYIRHKSHALHFVRAEEPEDKRPKMPASRPERLSYYRAYFNTPVKSQIWYTHVWIWEVTIWVKFATIVFMILPYFYILLFVSRYSPEEHLYLSKMVPCCWGSNILVIFSAMAELILYTDQLTIMLDYALFGIIYRAPWHVCTQDFYELKGKIVNCYNLGKFRKMTEQNDTIFMDGFYFLNGNYFQSAEMIYYWLRREEHGNPINNLSSYVWIYDLVIWIGAACCFNQLFKKYIWRVLHVTFWIMASIFMLTILYVKVLTICFDFKVDQVKRLLESSFSLLMTDIEVLGEASASAPPILHVITARSDLTVQPGLDSALLVVSNYFYYFLQMFTYSRLKLYCDVKAGIETIFDIQNSFPVFYLWPIFFKTFTLGRFYTMIFYVVLFIMEFLTFVITFQCFVETLTCEWPQLKRWAATLLITLSGLVVSYATDRESHLFFYVFSRVYVTITEVFTICFIYPLDRLLEDIQFFFYGDHISKIITFTLLWFPYIYLCCILYAQYYFELFYKVINVDRMYEILVISYVPLVLLLVGSIGYGFWIKFWKKQSLQVLTFPVTTWGPRDYVLRRFRKLFDSRTFIDSLSSRFLGRFMLRQGDPPCYRLELQYDESMKDN